MIIGKKAKEHEEIEINETFLRAYKNMIKEKPKLKYLAIGRKNKIKQGGLGYREFVTVVNAYHLYKDNFERPGDGIVIFGESEADLAPLFLAVYHNLMKEEGMKVKKIDQGFQSGEVSYKILSINYEGRMQKVNLTLYLPISAKNILEEIKGYLKKAVKS